MQSPGEDLALCKCHHNPRNTKAEKGWRKCDEQTRLLWMEAGFRVGGGIGHNPFVRAEDEEEWKEQRQIPALLLCTISASDNVQAQKAKFGMKKKNVKPLSGAAPARPSDKRRSLWRQFWSSAVFRGALATLLSDVVRSSIKFGMITESSAFLRLRFLFVWTFSWPRVCSRVYSNPVSNLFPKHRFSELWRGSVAEAMLTFRDYGDIKSCTWRVGGDGGGDPSTDANVLSHLYQQK